MGGIGGIMMTYMVHRRVVRANWWAGFGVGLMNGLIIGWILFK